MSVHQVFSRRKQSTMAKSIFLLSLFTATFVFSQERRTEKGLQDRISPVMFEAISMFGPDSNKAYVDVHYRIPRRFFVYVRPNDPAAPRDEFIARGQLQVELFNEQDVSVAREIRPLALKRTPVPPGEEQQGDIEGAIVFAVAQGELKIVFEVDDLESGRSFVDKKHTVQARLVSTKSLDLSPPFFAGIDTTHGVRYLPFNHGTNVMYGSVHGGMVSQVYCPTCDSTLRIDWNLTGEKEGHSEEIKKLDGTRFDVASGLLNLVAKEGPVAYDSKPSGSSWKILYVPVPLEQLEPGQYKLALHATDGKEHFRHVMKFRVIWPDRPMSLGDWDIATDALRYIAKPEEMDKINSSAADGGMTAFRAFWRQRDPDTTTAYNAIMVEYYHRVDEAIRQFSTVKEQDGYKTDRGRIFILDGPPTRVERSVLPGQPSREIWTYDNIKKQFVFTEKNRSGNYILTQSNTL
jgi:GWxTD domain-containing protein